MTHFVCVCTENFEPFNILFSRKETFILAQIFHKILREVVTL